MTDRRPAIVGGVLALAVSLTWVGHTAAVIDCAWPLGDLAVAKAAVTGQLPEAERWTTMVIGSVTANVPGPDGYREATIQVEISFTEASSTSLMVFYPSLNDEDVGASFLGVGNRYFVAARSDDPYVPGLETDACTATRRLSASEARSLLELDMNAQILVPGAFDAQGPPGELFVGLMALAAIAALAVWAARSRRASR